MDDPSPNQSPPESIDKTINHRPSSEELSIQYASRWLRLAAAILDCLVVAPLSISIAYYLGFHVVPQCREWTFSEQICLVLIGAVVFGVLNLRLIYTRGQTIGKMICGTVVVTKDFRRVSGNRYVFLRILPVWIIGEVPFVGVLFSILDLLAIFRPEKNCIHDDIAGTRVIMYRDLNEKRTQTGQELKRVRS